MTRNRLIAALAAAGIEPRRITAHRDGSFSLVFVPADAGSFYSRGTDPARVWAERIQSALPLADIINGHDSIAGWRPAAPVLSALVQVAFPAQRKSA